MLNMSGLWLQTLELIWSLAGSLASTSGAVGAWAASRLECSSTLRDSSGAACAALTPNPGFPCHEQASFEP